MDKRRFKLGLGAKERKEKSGSSDAGVPPHAASAAALGLPNNNYMRRTPPMQGKAVRGLAASFGCTYQGCKREPSQQCASMMSLQEPGPGGRERGEPRSILKARPIGPLMPQGHRERESKSLASLARLA